MLDGNRNFARIPWRVHQGGIDFEQKAKLSALWDHTLLQWRGSMREPNVLAPDFQELIDSRSQSTNSTNTSVIVIPIEGRAMNLG